ncbi:MAG TPA: hypothetical protein EYG31_04555 [Porticoccaceae bacterium]|jgi:hypothetical protein|nr:hypothetical protein [Gammaproteobacteria bacterium]HIL59892.1 hypothetical protein [Porticoccaceae bacterium]
MGPISKKLTSAFSAVILVFVFISASATAEILSQATPDGGVQPRLVVDSSGGIHLLYFKKRINRPSAREGNLYYRQYDVENRKFGLPVKVSSEAFNMQTFSIARASLAVDDSGRAHVIWYKPREGEYLYSRSNPERSQFEAQKSMVSEYAVGIDAGADIAASENHVAIVWGAGDLSREQERTVFARLSNDFGASFGAELSMGNKDLGACACCSLAVEYSENDKMLIAYRSAIDRLGRHMQILKLNGVDEGISDASYGSVHELQEWEMSSCPLSTNDIVADNEQQYWLVFETASRIVQLNISGEAPALSVGEPFTKTRQKNPTIAFNGSNEKLIAWGEAIAHSRGGRLNFRLYDSQGKQLDSEPVDEMEMPKYSFPAAAGLPSGDFLLLY